MKKFYKDVYANAVCPLGFIKECINMNYYDDKRLHKLARPFIIETLKQQAQFGMRNRTLICVGEGSNYKCVTEINKEQKIFEDIIALPHPRWVMQYRRKTMAEYVKRYVEVINRLAEKKLARN